MKKFLILPVLALLAVSCNYDTSDPHYTFGDLKSGQNEYNFKNMKDMPREGSKGKPMPQKKNGQ